MSLNIELGKEMSWKCTLPPIMSRSVVDQCWLLAPLETGKAILDSTVHASQKYIEITRILLSDQNDIFGILCTLQYVLAE